MISSYTGFAKKYIGRTVKYIASSFTTGFELAQLRGFQSMHAGDLGASTRAIRQAVEAATANVRWVDNNYQDIWDWLKLQNAS